MHPAPKHIPLPLDEAFSPFPNSPPDAPHGRTALPIVAAEVLGPEEINVGGVAAYTVVVANLGEAVVDHVQVKVALPPAAEARRLHPRPVSCEGDCATFDVGRLAPKSRQRLQLELTPHEQGPLELRAEAVFSVTAFTTTKVCRPELAITVLGPEAVVVGDPATFKVVIANYGDGPAENVTVMQHTADELPVSRSAAHVGRLGPGETREIYLSATTHHAGRLRACFTATAWGGIEVAAQAEVCVARPMLALEASGPRVCAVQSPEVFSITLANPGDAPASNVEAVAAIPPGVQVLAFDRPVQFEAARRIVRWRVPVLPPGGRETLRLKAAALHADHFTLEAAAAADYGLRAEAEHGWEAARSFARGAA